VDWNWKQKFETGRVIGVPVTAGTLGKVAEEIVRVAEEGRSGYVCVANVHMVTTARRNTKLRTVMKGALLVTSDGMPLVWSLRCQGFKDARQVTGSDLMEQVCKLAESEGLSIYFYGGSSETMQALQKAVARRFPALKVAGYESPPLLPQQPSADTVVVNRIKESGTRIVFVGLGCPKQEYWMAEYAPHLPSVLIGVGAAFDFLAGTVKRAPKWMQKIGLEWLFRLISEPRRLWKRYLVTNSLFCYYLAKDWVYRRFK
jgi:N-acetylglucosaminyldiphosphoundecaprenol N-acetyl-beta-D-mannosaminyltransferase